MQDDPIRVGILPRHGDNPSLNWTARKVIREGTLPASESLVPLAVRVGLHRCYHCHLGIYIFLTLHMSIIS